MQHFIANQQPDGDLRIEWRRTIISSVENRQSLEEVDDLFVRKCRIPAIPTAPR